MRHKVHLLASCVLAFVVGAACAEEDHTIDAARGAIVNPTDGPAYRLFESGQVRPLAASPDGRLLFAANTPDNRLEVFKTRPTLRSVGSVMVGLEPVAVAVRSRDEVWVVNHLSDSVSIVDTSNPRAPRVVRTLLVGDEPRDIVFGGPDRDRAFITTAHRGQNNPADPQLTTPGVGRADVWVFDADHLGSSLGGTPLTIVTLFSDTPRALAVTPDGARVYAAAFHSGNRTTTITESVIPDGGEAAGGLPGVLTNAAGVPAPETGLIVRHDGEHWVDELGRSFDALVRFNLPDLDVFAIDATANPPVAVSGAGGRWAGVGTVIFNLAVNPVNGKVYVANTDAQNHVRFEGPGEFGGSTVRGHLAESRITVLDGASVLPRHLNKHIDFSSCCEPPGGDEARRSLAFPQDMVVSSDGETLYVTAFGSSKIGVFATAELESDTFTPSEDAHIAVSGGGPAGVVLDEARDRLYVLTRFDNGISVIDTSARVELAHVVMPSPEPASVTQGRRFLYDATHTSSHGDSACASCHINADFDSLAWDLGDPDGEVLTNPGPFIIILPFLDPDFHPMKGPMTTQSLRGMANHGSMHWRGDRTGGNDAPNAQPDSGTFDEDAAFRKFNPAFVGLIGRDAPLPDDEMQAFTDFILQVTYPPNPIRALDNSLTPDEAAGRNIYFTRVTDTVSTCNGCHVLDPDGNREHGVAAPGFFGSDGKSTFEAEPQFFKVAHLRNMYQKIGMFGMVESPLIPFSDGSFTGDQVRGFGFLHDGSIDTLFRFVSAGVFIQTFDPSPLVGLANPGGFPLDATGVMEKRQVEAFLLAFDSNLAPIVGQQITLGKRNGAAVGPRIDLLIARAAAGECDLVVKGRSGGRERGYLWVGGEFVPDRAAEAPRSDAGLRALARHAGRELTYTCAPPGSGVRVGLDRDGDGILDGDEARGDDDDDDDDD